MLKNRKYIVAFLIVFIIGIMMSFICSNKVYGKYVNEIYDYNAILISGIVEKHPELKDDIITILLDEEKIPNYELIEQMGLGYVSFDYIGNHKKMNETIMFTNLFIVTLVSILFAIIFLIYKYFEKKKINELSLYMREIINDNYNLDIREYEEGNISSFKNDIYKVTIKLKEQHDISIKDKKDLEATLSDISHQLKTPLTSMYVINDLLKTNLSEDKKIEFLNKNADQLERIEWLVKSLLKISMLDSGTIKFEPKKSSVYEIINAAINPLRVQLELKNINTNIKCDSKLTIKVDKNWVVEAILNIIKNAYEHTNSGGNIDIEVTDNPIYIEMRISDNGCGIKKEDINHIFERFYRSSNSSKESVGIGLNMTKKIIDLSAADIRVMSKEKEGTTFIIKFYKN